MELSRLTWTEAEPLLKGALALWPIGAIEAHGPHLPLGTDGIIAVEMARRAAIKLEKRGRKVVVLPLLPIMPAKFAATFAGTLSLSGGTAAAAICDVARSLEDHGVEKLVFSNCHVDPANLKAVEAAVEAIDKGRKLKAVFPNIARKPWASRLPDEFKRGGAHAGLFETSLVLAADAKSVRTDVMKGLAKVEVDLGAKIKDGARSFIECGGNDAYFGDPAAATAAQGEAWYEVLSDILVEAAG